MMYYDSQLIFLYIYYSAWSIASNFIRLCLVHLKKYLEVCNLSSQFYFLMLFYQHISVSFFVLF